MQKIIVSNKTPKAVGPYSAGLVNNGIIFISGQLPINKEGYMPESIQEQTKQSIANIKALLAEEGATLKNVIKTTVFLKDIDDFVAMNEIYAQEFEEPFPTRSAFAVAALPKNAKVEIECIAMIN